MQIKLKNKIHTVPTSTADVTLQQRIDFNTLYGKDIAIEQKALLEAEEKDELAITELYLHTACKAISFFADIPLSEVYEIQMSQVLSIYDNCLKQILEPQEDVELINEFVWNDEIWKLEQPELNYQSDINFNQFLSSKQVVKMITDAGGDNWDAIPSLCSIFLKRETEEFNENWLAGDSERIELMKSLPLDIALQVGFFLRSSMNLFLKVLQSSEVENQEKDQV